MRLASWPVSFPFVAPTAHLPSPIAPQGRGLALISATASSASRSAVDGGLGLVDRVRSSLAILRLGGLCLQPFLVPLPLLSLKRVGSSAGVLFIERARWWYRPLCKRLLRSGGRLAGGRPRGLRVFREGTGRHHRSPKSLTQNAINVLRHWRASGQESDMGNEDPCDLCCCQSHEVLCETSAPA